MELKLNDILHLTEEEINNSKIELNMKGGFRSQTTVHRPLATVYG